MAPAIIDRLGDFMSPIELPYFNLDLLEDSSRTLIHRSVGARSLSVVRDVLVGSTLQGESRGARTAYTAVSLFCMLLLAAMLGMLSFVPDQPSTLIGNYKRSLERERRRRRRRWPSYTED